jgi:hypothetical protein
MKRHFGEVMTSFFENKDVRAANVGVQFIDLKKRDFSRFAVSSFTDIPRFDRPYTVTRY